MSGGGTRRWRLRRPRLVGVLVVCLLAATIAPANGQPAELRATEGTWIGQVSFVSAGLAFRGSFQFVSAGGTVDGGFEWAGGGAVLGGTVTGPDTMPQFILTYGTSGGITIPDVTGGGEVQFLRASCERLEGIGVNINGPQTITDIDWWAIREGATEEPEAFFEALEGLQTEINLLIDDVEAGRIILTDVFADLELAITAAEDLAADLDRTVGCGLEFYRSVIAAEVNRLLEFALESPDINVFDFARVVLAAVSAGLMGSGAEPFATELDTQVRSVVSWRIADAIEAGDEVELMVLAGLAEQLGYVDAAAQADAALAVLAE